jgi:hypothetical protein
MSISLVLSDPDRSGRRLQLAGQLSAESANLLSAGKPTTKSGTLLFAGCFFHRIAAHLPTAARRFDAATAVTTSKLRAPPELRADSSREK